MTTNAQVAPSVDQLRRDAERRRAQLSGTVDDLRTQIVDTASDVRQRLSPAAIKAEVKDYVRETREQLWHTIERKARDNPMQAVAIGAGLAYPLWNLMRSMPAPLLLIGAGLLLSRSTSGASGSGSVAAKAFDDLRDTGRGLADTVGEGAERVSDAARRTLHDTQDYARDKVSSAIDSVSSAVRGASGAAASLKDNITATTVDAASAVADSATSAYQATTEAVDAAKDRVVDVGRQAKQTLSDAFEQNPLIVAGVGLAIGALIASSLPSTRTEDSLFGDTSDELRRQAERAGARGIKAAKAVVDNVANAATDQGLSVDGLSAAAANISEKVRAVADRGVRAAMGEPEQKTSNPSTNAAGGRS
jgi:ElaB/YqjD/DUF883 family membrane-anchored ribosome-binding protein